MLPIKCSWLAVSAANWDFTKLGEWPNGVTQVRALGCRESAIHQGRHGVAQRSLCLGAGPAWRNPGVADLMVIGMGRADAGSHEGGEASEAREQLARAGFNAPQCWDLRARLRPWHSRS